MDFIGLSVIKSPLPKLPRGFVTLISLFIFLTDVISLLILVPAISESISRSGCFSTPVPAPI